MVAIFTYPVNKIALYIISNRRSNLRLLAVSPTHFVIKEHNKEVNHDLKSIIKIDIDSKKKLVPLITGGIITSLSLLSMVIYPFTLNLITIMTGGLLLFYYGLTNYVVISLETRDTNLNIWLPQKHQMNHIKPFVHFINYYLQSGHVPTLNLATKDIAHGSFIHHSDKPVLSDKWLTYRWDNTVSPDDGIITINPAILDAPILFNQVEGGIARSRYLINADAVIRVSEK